MHYGEGTMKSIDIQRKDGTKIQNEFQSNNSGILGILFSGFSYTYKNPLLYYSRNILFDNSFDYLGIDYQYYCSDYFGKLDEEEQDAFFDEDNRLIARKIVEISENYKKLILIGKSMGTTAINHCINNDKIRNKAIIVYITPWKDWERIINEIKNTENKILIISSFQDKYYNVKNLKETRNKSNIELYELKEGNHSLETGDTIKNIEQLKEIMIVIKAFIENNSK